MFQGKAGQKLRLYSILKESKETVLELTNEQQKFCENIKMVEYNKVNVKSSDSQLNKLKSAAKKQTGVTLRINIKIFNGNNLPHELLLIARKN